MSTLKTYFLKVKTLFFDLNIIFLIANTFLLGCKTNTNFVSVFFQSKLTGHKYCKMQWSSVNIPGLKEEWFYALALASV